MNNFYSDLALQQQDDDLIFQNIIHTPMSEQHIIQNDYVTNYSPTSVDLLDGDFQAINNSVGGSNLTINEKGKRQKQSSTAGNQGRLLRRDIERQRRQDMASLYSSLRSQLPQEYIKGKSSISDLIHHATNYVNHKKKNIEELKIKRDALKLLASANDIDHTNQDSSCSYLPIDVQVSSYSDGIQILISVDLRRDVFQLSKVLEVLLAEGLGVVGCVCTQANGRILHTIQTEVGELDIHEFQQKLTDFVNTP